jgi:hypothetical protein
VAASRVDGLVLTLTPNSHNYNYRSAVLFGRAAPVVDPAEKLWAMELITDSVLRDHWRHTRVPPNAAEMASTQILRVAIDSASCKIREGVPSDEVADLRDGALLGRVWTGVVPLFEVLGDPIPGPYNRVEDVPQHLRDYRQMVNADNEEYATAAGRKPAPVKRKERAEDE